MRMKHLSRLLCMMLVAVLLVTMFAACSSTAPTINPDDEPLWSGSGAGNSTTADTTQTTTGTTTGTTAGESTTTGSTTTGTTGSITTTTTVTGATTKPPVLKNNVVAQVKTVNGTPALYINGERQTGNLFFVNGDMTGASNTRVFQRQISYAAENGINTFSTIYNMNYTYKENTRKDLVFSTLRSKVETITSMTRDAKILMRLSFIASSQTFGDSALTEYNGTTDGRVSIASDEWLEESVKRVKDLVNYVRQDQTMGPYIYGYHLDLGEWFPSNFTLCVDTSEVNQKKFREWLTNKYKTDAALQAAWGSNVTLATAQVPTDQIGGGLWLDTSRADNIDYYDYWSWLTASRVEAIAKAIKEASNNENVVISFFGYYFEQYHGSTGHWNFRSLLESPYLDGFASPASYMDRNGSNPNTATSGYMTTAESVVRAGKLWVMESDERTYINTFSNEKIDYGVWRPLETLQDIQEVHKREMGIAMIHGTTMYPMDLQGYGWYDDERIWENYGKLEKAYAAYAQNRKEQPKFEVALVVDESAQSLVGSNFPLTNTALAQNMLNMYRAGISFGLVELTDLMLGRADDYKTYLFVNPYRLSENEIDTIAAKLHKDNKTGVYLYSFGNATEAQVKKLTGMDIKTVNKSADHSLTLVEQNKVLGLNKLSAVESNPLSYVTGSYTTILAKYSDGSIGGATYEAADWKSVFLGTTGFGTASTIRGLAQYGGANVFIDTDDVLVANQNMVMLHASKAGDKTVKFGKKVDVYDYFANKWYTNVDSITIDNMEKATCRWLFYGTKAEIEAMKLPTWKN